MQTETLGMDRNAEQPPTEQSLEWGCSHPERRILLTMSVILYCESQFTLPVSRSKFHHCPQALSLWELSE